MNERPAADDAAPVLVVAATEMELAPLLQALELLDEFPFWFDIVTP